jgi:hypothetical protein
MYTRAHTRTHTHTHGRVPNPPRRMSDAWATFVVPDTRHMYMILRMPPILSPRTPDLILLRFRIIPQGSTDHMLCFPDRTRARGRKPAALLRSSLHSLRRSLLLPRGAVAIMAFATFAVLLVQVAVLLRVVQVVVIMRACHDGSHGHCALSGRCGAVLLRSQPTRLQGPVPTRRGACDLCDPGTK